MATISRRKAPPSPGFSSRRLSIAWGSMGGRSVMGLSSGCPLEGGVGLDLVDGRQAQQDLLQAVVAQGPVPDLGGRLRDLLDAALLGDERADLLGDEDELMDRDAALVAGVPALGAAPAAVEGHVG